MNGLRYSTEGNYSTTTLSKAMCDVTSVHYSVDPIAGTCPKRFEQDVILVNLNINLVNTTNMFHNFHDAQALDAKYIYIYTHAGC